MLGVLLIRVSIFFSICKLLQLENLPSMVAGVWSEDGNLQLESTTQFRKLLSIGIALGSFSFA